MGTGDQRSAVEADRLAELIRRQTARILADYQDALASLGNAIVENPVSLQQARENAQQILADVCASLNAGEVRVGETFRLVSWNIGVTRASDGVHPTESLQASSVFFRTVLAVAAETLGTEPEAFSLLMMVAMALERSITLRVRTAMAGYTSFLLNQVHEAQVTERRRIARDLHDRIGHCISVTHRQLELFNLYQGSDPGKANQKVEAAQRAIRESMQNLRAVTSDLYAVEPFKSLDVALTNYMDGANIDGVDVRVRVNGDESWAPPEVLDETFLVLREAAHNALNHARPTTLIINVDITPHELRAFVEDDGTGFDPQEPPRSGGLGISSMRERVRLLGGTFAVRSRTGHGTHIDFAVGLAGGEDLDNAE
jgi:signal transduction histidine kinase